MKPRISCVNGYVNLRTAGKSSKRFSLKIPMDKKTFDKFFDVENQEFKQTVRGTSLPHYERYNLIIEQAFKDYKNSNSSLSFVNDDKKLFLKYWEKYISLISNHGTTLKNKLVKDKFQKYLTSIHKSDILFKDINTEFLRNLQHYFQTASDPKKLSKNTANHYMKMTAIVYRQAATDEHYVYSKDPFIPLKYKYEAIKRSVLSQEDVYKLLNKKLPANKRGSERVDLSRDMFLFQIFANGMRVSDLLTLRWSNINGERLIYTMFKSRKHVDISLNKNIFFILFKQLGGEGAYKNLIDTFNLALLKKERGTHHLGLEVKKRKEDIYMSKKIDNDLNIEQYLSNYLKEFIKQRNATGFIFPFLKDEEYKDVTDFNNLELAQYKNINTQTINYNNSLKRLAEICEIDLPTDNAGHIKIASHTSRHTFANLVLMIKDVNTYDLQQMLRHSSIAVTNKYLKDGFNTNKQDGISRELVEFIPKERDYKSPINDVPVFE
ncbi:MAG TPA: phage integrase SAM-like domain-containing protein [Ferruginibacter sp.]|jgi:integrase|nr:phage integrase SAM-like domain-containing protein [Ferruginibacter sp.]